MQSAQESLAELRAAIRYCENAISAAESTIESMDFRQQLAKQQAMNKQEYQERTGREAVLESELAGVRQLLDKMTLEHTEREEALEAELQRQKDLGQGYYDSMMTFIEEVAELKEFNAELSKQNVSLAEGKPTMPVIPKDVAIAIFREGIQTGVLSACAEIEGQRIDVEESEYIGGFEVSFSKIIDLDDELDLDWMRGKVGQYNEEFVVDALRGLCADKDFECRIHGIDNQEEKKND